MAFHLGLKRALHLVLGKARIVDIDDPANQQKGNKGTDQGNQNELPMQSRIVLLPLCFLAF
jgi:hypothetical protein